MGRRQPKHHHPPQNKKKASQIDNEARLPPDPPEDILSEALAYQELAAKMRDRLSKEVDESFLISTKWFSSWKEYSGYDALIKGEDPQKAKGFGKKRPGKMNTDLLDKKAEKDLIEVPQQLPEYSYLSQVLDRDMEREKDYIVVDSPVFTLFFDKYEGVCIKRPMRRKKKGMPYIDAHLHSFYVVEVSRTQANRISEASESAIKKQYQDFLEVKKMQTSSIWDIKKFKDYLGQYLMIKHSLEAEPKEIKLWKFQNFLSIKQVKQQLVDAVRKGDGLINARLLAAQQDNEYDLDDFLKENTIVFIDYSPSGAGVSFLPGELPEEIEGYCEECIQKKSLFSGCFCNKVFYCSDKCKYDDKLYHFRTCGRAYESSDDEEYETKAVKSEDKASDALCGLQNLGNTCYMNASLQCLTNIKGLKNYFLANEYLKNINKKELEQNNGIFIKKFAKFLKKLQENKSYAPWSIKMQISYFNALFKGYDQHDANDLITYLLNDLNEFVEKPEGINFASFLTDTFLGEFNSNVECPGCNISSTTKDPFLEVSLPVKSKQSLKDQPFVIVKSWNHLLKGTYEVKATWQEIFKDLNIDSKNNNVQIFMGSEGCDIRRIEDDTPEAINKRSKKDVVVFYLKENNSRNYKDNNIQQIPVYLSFLKYLSGNQAKCGYGYPVFLDIDTSQPLYDIYVKLAEYFDIGEEKMVLLNQFIHKLKQEREELLKSLENYDENAQQPPEPQPVVTNSKNSKNATKKEPPKPKTKAQLIEEFDNKLESEFQETFGPLLNFRLIVRSARRSGKKACNFCEKKCSQCTLPCSTHLITSEFIKRGGDDWLELELVLKEVDPIQIDKATPNYSLNTTIEQCLDEFQKPEQLDEENPWFCMECNDLKLAFKQLKIQKYPEVLLLHLKRFKDVNGKKVKNNQPIAYQDTLVIPGEEGKQSLVYHLNSVIVHEGSLEGGHYWAICRKNRDKWYSFNDDKVKEEKDAYNKSAYILFYEKASSSKQNNISESNGD